MFDITIESRHAETQRWPAATDEQIAALVAEKSRAGWRDVLVLANAAGEPCGVECWNGGGGVRFYPAA